MPDSFWVASHRFDSATGEQKGITQTIYTDSEPPSQLPNSFNAKRQAEKPKPPTFYIFGVTRSGIEPREDALTTMPRGGGIMGMASAYPVWS